MANKNLAKIEEGKVYRATRQGHQGNSSAMGGIILKGSTIDVIIYGSQTRPADLSEMVDITESGAIDAAGAYAFSLLPDYIAVVGTVTAIELVGYVGEETSIQIGD